MNETTKKLLRLITGGKADFGGAYSIRENGKCADMRSSENIRIEKKTDKPGLDIRIRPNTKGETLAIPACVTHGGVDDLVYNDFYIGEDADVVIVAGCGVHTEHGEPARHNGIHRFFLARGAHVKYVEKHIGTGGGAGARVINPVTDAELAEDAYLEMNTTQIGGVDSTLAVIICAEAVKMMGLPADYVTAVTMPCFGTTDRTKSNAIIVSEQLGATVRVIDIGESVMQHFKDIGHDPENRNVVYENSQARERTQILMDVANGFADGGIHVGTEDMSEFADGWCTYNGDHISMYDVNAGSTKTMVQMVVRYVAETTDDKVLAKALLDVLDTPVSPELLPPTRNGEIAQKSEDSVGPYNLQDFFLYYLVDHGFAPEKVLRLADIAYGDEFDHATLKKWLRSYCRRLFSQQFKRSCLQDGPTLNGFSFSPRTGFSMPSDGSDALYLATVDALK